MGTCAARKDGHKMGLVSGTSRVPTLPDELWEHIFNIGDDPRDGIYAKPPLGFVWPIIINRGSWFAARFWATYNPFRED